MKITGSYEIEADRETVWKALNDPDVLKDCIPGCDSLEMTGENELTAAVTAKVGPVKAKFSGTVELKDLNPPTSYRIEGSGKGGAAGFAKGGADVTLEDREGGGTVLNYEADAQVGGKLAQVGGRLIDGTARKMADQFFAKFRDHVEGSGAEAAAGTEAETETAEAAPAAEAARPEAEPAAGPAAEAAAEAEPAPKTATPEAAQAVPPKTPPESGGAEKTSGGLPAWVWFIGAVALILVLVALVS